MTLQAYLNPDQSIDFDSPNTPINSVPLGVYIPKYSEMRGIYLSKTNDFKYLPEYYLLDKFEEYVLDYYKESDKSVGVIYLGLKGSGKTKRAHKLALDTGLPVLYIQNLDIINKSAWKDTVASGVFNNFVIFIDEYEKKLEEETTVALLEWLDGSSNSKQLFILIGNERANNKFSNPLIDRLSRVLWRKNFGSLKQSEVEELVYKLSIREDKEDLIEVITSIPVLSLDNTLQIIKTTNLFADTSVEEIVSMLNIEFNEYDTYYLCDEFNQVVNDNDTTSISIKKNKISYEKTTFYSYVNRDLIEKLALTNKDIDTDECVRIDIDFESLVFKVFNKNRLGITVNYQYYSLETKEYTTSTETINLFLLRDVYYFSKLSTGRFLTFGNAL
jgi:hypothetical protein